MVSSDWDRAANSTRPLIGEVVPLGGGLIRSSCTATLYHHHSTVKRIIKKKKKKKSLMVVARHWSSRKRRVARRFFSPRRKITSTRSLERLDRFGVPIISARFSLAEHGTPHGQTIPLAPGRGRRALARCGSTSPILAAGESAPSLPVTEMSSRQSGRGHSGGQLYWAWPRLARNILDQIRECLFYDTVDDFTVCPFSKNNASLRCWKSFLASTTRRPLFVPNCCPFRP
jgi:hypothetical protein